MKVNTHIYPTSYFEFSFLFTELKKEDTDATKEDEDSNEHVSDNEGINQIIYF